MRTMDVRPPWSLRLAVLMCWLYGAVVLGLMLDSRLAVVVLTLSTLGLAWAQARGHIRRARARLAELPLRTTGAELTGDAGQHFISPEFAAAQQGHEVTLVLFGFDRFEAFMEREGPEAGADALHEFGAALKQIARDMRVPARYGWRGNAFLAVLPESSLETSQLFAQRVRQRVENSPLAMPQIITGFARFGADTRSPEEFVEAAENALAAARAEHVAQARQFVPRGGMPNRRPRVPA